MEGVERECGGYTNPWRRRVGEDWLWLVATVSSKWLTLGPLWRHCVTTLGPLWRHCVTTPGPLWRHYVTTFSKNSFNKWTLAALHHLIKWLSAVLLASKYKVSGTFWTILVLNHLVLVVVLYLLGLQKLLVHRAMVIVAHNSSSANANVGKIKISRLHY